MLYLAYRQAGNRQRRKRRWAVHPINRSRFVDGAFHNLYGKLRDDGEKFFNFFRMSVASFDELVSICQEIIQTRQDLVQGLAFSPQEMLAITIR